MQRRQENWLKYNDFAELKKITIRIYSNCFNYFLIFESFKFGCCPFCMIKKTTVDCTSVLSINCTSVLVINCTSVLLILRFTSY